MISVCICTFKRNLGLQKLLDVLFRQITDGFAYEVIVVDNDKDRGAEAIIGPIMERVEGRLIYDVEPQQNIALARNRSVSLATGNYIAFIDDDEQPAENWLFELLHAIKKYNADAVFGPVMPVYPSNTPEWIIKGGFFERPEHEDGTFLDTGRTGNALVKKDWLDKYEKPFNDVYGLTGGEDSDFFSRIKDEGARFCWAAKAVVREEIEDARLNRKWLLSRAFRGGQGYADRLLKSKSMIRKMTHCSMRLAGALFAQVVAIAMLPAGFYRFVWWQRKVMSNLGQASVVFKYRYEEYKKK